MHADLVGEGRVSYHEAARRSDLWVITNSELEI